jgi:hypothetical protein
MTKEHNNMSANTINKSNTASSHIPLSLQAVFLASNRGDTVYQPPPECKTAFKVSRRRNLFSFKRSSQPNTKMQPNYVTDFFGDETDDPTENFAEIWVDRKFTQGPAIAVRIFI